MKLVIQRLLVLVLVTSVVTPQYVSAALPEIYAGGVLAYTNAQRYRNGLPILESNARLSKAAYTKMQDMFARQYFAHESPSGDSVSDLANNVGYAYLSVGENLALGDFGSSKAVVEAWMDSPGHRANILSTTFSEIGIAAGRSRYEGRTTWIIVQAFGLPRSSCPGVDERMGAQIEQLQDRLDLLERVVDIRREAVEERGISRLVYAARVASYNTAAELYNDTAETYRDLVDTYNEGVDQVNSCITTKVR